MHYRTLYPLHKHDIIDDNVVSDNFGTMQHKLQIMMNKYKLEESNIEFENVDIASTKVINEMISSLLLYIDANDTEKYDLYEINKHIHIDNLIEIIGLFFKNDNHIFTDGKLINLNKQFKSTLLNNISNTHVPQNDVLLNFEKLVKERKYGKTNTTDALVENKTTDNVVMSTESQFIIDKNDLVDCLKKLTELYTTLSTRLIWKEKISTLSNLTIASFQKYCAKREEYNYKNMIQTQLQYWSKQYETIVHLCQFGEYNPNLTKSVDESNEDKLVTFLIPDDKYASEIKNMITDKNETDVQFLTDLTSKLNLAKLERDLVLLRLIFNQHYKSLNDVIGEYIKPNYCKICVSNEANKLLLCGHVICDDCIETLHVSKVSNIYDMDNRFNVIDCPYCKKSSKINEIKKIYY